MGDALPWRKKPTSRFRWTAPERKLAEALYAAGLSFEAHDTKLPGRPDFVFRNRRVIVMVDGNFWHGKDFHEFSAKLSPAWRAKIRAKRDRDPVVTAKLEALGWKVCRAWESDINERLDFVVARILQTVLSRPLVI